MQTLVSTAAISGLADRLALYGERARSMLRCATLTEKYVGPTKALPYYTTAEERRTMHKMHAEGRSITEIMHETGRSRKCIQDILSRRGSKLIPNRK